MKIDQYISDLLYDHECVIVTDLGGFIANYRPASINPALHVVTPPSKKLAFNASLNNNDGLLANYVAQKSRLTYPEACDVINEYVQEAFRGLKTGQKLRIDKVGVLYFDNEQRLQFSPEQNTNYLLESFGMSAVHAPLIRRQEREVSEAIPSVAAEMLDSVQEKHTRTGKRKWKILEMIPAAAVLAILFLAPPALQEFNTNLSTLLPFSRINEFVEDVKSGKPEKVQIVIPYKNPFEIEPLHKRKVNQQPDASAVVKEKPVQLPAEENKTINDTDVKKPEAEPESRVNVAPAGHASVFPLTEDIAEKGYHIIGGCFRSKENAHNFAENLKSKNIDARMIGQNRSGLFMVSVFTSPELNMVNDQMEEMKSKVNTSVWIHKQ